VSNAIWHLASDGMMPVPWSRHMVERFVQFDNDLIAMLSNGELWLKPLNENKWRRILSEIPQIMGLFQGR